MKFSKVTHSFSCFKFWFNTYSHHKKVSYSRSWYSTLISSAWNRAGIKQNKTKHKPKTKWKKKTKTPNHASQEKSKVAYLLLDMCRRVLGWQCSHTMGVVKHIRFPASPSRCYKPHLSLSSSLTKQFSVSEIHRISTCRGSEEQSKCFTQAQKHNIGVHQQGKMKISVAVLCSNLAK